MAVLGVLVLDVLSVMRIDSRVTEVQKNVIEDRSRSMKFTFFQIILTQITASAAALLIGYVLQNVVVISILNYPVSPLVLVSLAIGIYLYVFTLNTAPINWYITGQPFWIQTKDILILPLSTFLFALIIKVSSRASSGLTNTGQKPSFSTANISSSIGLLPSA